MAVLWIRLTVNKCCPIDKYKSNQDDICNELQTEFPNAILEFATTTLVPEDEPGRFVGMMLNRIKPLMRC
ncbi:MAG: hypothetical protein N4A74_17825 [Carboxylicivirga sp.]|jgi:hypothetical protein|nr:hypothetical protein [Carboxylicivirga sp.]